MGITGALIEEHSPTPGKRDSVAEERWHCPSPWAEPGTRGQQRGRDEGLYLFVLESRCPLSHKLCVWKTWSPAHTMVSVDPGSLVIPVL